MGEQLNLSNLKPAQERKDRKRVGRGLGSGKGRYAGRGIKGQKSRAGSHKMRAGFVRDLDRFEADDEVTPESLVEKGILKNTKIDVKLLGTGEISKKLVVRLHAISATAREKIEAAGGTVELLREPKERKQRKHAKPAETPEPEEQAAAEAGDETPVDEAAAEAPEASAEEAPEE